MTARVDHLLGYLRRLTTPAEVLDVADDVLLSRFIVSRDEGAFARLMARHGPMVLGLCRRVLGSVPDAEDAFQATFLALARQASRVRPADRLGGYLHTVALRIACKARASLQRRRRALPLSFGTSAPDPHPDPLADLSAREMLTVLDTELQRLPEVERVALVLCCLEGLTQEEAARRLGWTPDSVRGRLQRGRARLAVRLSRRGITLPAVLLAIKIADGAASAAVPILLASRTVHAAAAHVLGRSGATATVVALAESGLRGLALSRLKLGATLSLMTILALGGIATVVHPMLPAPSANVEPPVADPRPAGRTMPARTDLLGDPLPEGALARIGTTRLRVDGVLGAIVFSNDYRWIAYGTESGVVHVCEAGTGKPLFEMETEQFKPITELAFSPDGRTLAASGFWCKEVHLIDVATQKIRHTLSNTVEGQGNWARLRQGPGLAFTPDGQMLLVGGKDGALHFWDPATATEVAALAQTDELVLSLTLTTDGRTALTSHYRGALHLWDVTKRKHLRKLAASAQQPNFTALAPDGQTMALAASANEIQSWNIEGGLRHRLRLSTPVVGTGFRPDGLLQLAEGNGTITLWDVRIGATRSSFTCPDISVGRRDRTTAWFESQGKRMAWEILGTIRPWDLTTRQETPRLTAYPQGVEWAGFSADGRRLYACGSNGDLGVWDAATGRRQGAPRKIDAPWRACPQPAADRRRVAIASRHPDRNFGLVGGLVFLWDPAKDADPVPLRDQVGPAWYAALSPDNRFLVATEATGQIRVYDAGTGKPMRSFAGRKQEYRPTFSPDGQVLATTGAYPTIRLYHFPSGQVLRELKMPTSAVSLAFAPDGGSLASGHQDLPMHRDPGGPPGDMICLWETATGRELCRISAGHLRVEALCYSPDGLLLASGGFDRRIRVWEAATGQERRRYVGHRNQVESLDFAPDGLQLASASADGSALVWQVFDPAPAERTAAELDTLWTDLTKDGGEAHRAIAALIAAKRSAAFLSARLRPAEQPPKEQVNQWLADLRSPQFKTREAAQIAMLRVGEMIEPALRRALEASTDPEERQRLVTIRAGISLLERRPELLRELRAVEVLAHLGTAEARRVLAALAKGAPESRLTRQARVSLAQPERAHDRSKP